MEIVFPALLHQKSGSVTLTLFWVRLFRCISHYDSQIKTFCWHSSTSKSCKTLHRGMVTASAVLQSVQGWASLAGGSLGLKCSGAKGQSCREALPPWCTTALSPVPCWHSYPATRSREWSASGFSQRCEIQAEGGSGLEGWRQILLLPKEGVEKLLLKKWSFSGGSGWGGEKHIKRVMKRKQSTLFCFHFAFPSLHNQPPKQSLSCSWPSKL